MFKKCESPLSNRRDALFMPGWWRNPESFESLGRNSLNHHEWIPKQWVKELAPNAGKGFILAHAGSIEASLQTKAVLLHLISCLFSGYLKVFRLSLFVSHLSACKILWPRIDFKSRQTVFCSLGNAFKVHLKTFDSCAKYFAKAINPKDSIRRSALLSQSRRIQFQRISLLNIFGAWNITWN